MYKTPKHINIALKNHRFLFRKRTVYVEPSLDEPPVSVLPDEISDTDYERMVEEDKKAVALLDEDDYVEDEDLYSTPSQYKGDAPKEEAVYTEEEIKELEKVKKSAEKVEEKIKKRQRRISGKNSKSKRESRFEVYEEQPTETPEEKEKRLLYERINGDYYYDTEILPIDYHDKTERRKKFHINKYNLPSLILIFILLIVVVIATFKLFS